MDANELTIGKWYYSPMLKTLVQYKGTEKDWQGETQHVFWEPGNGLKYYFSPAEVEPADPRNK